MAYLFYAGFFKDVHSASKYFTQRRNDNQFVIQPSQMRYDIYLLSTIYLLYRYLEYFSEILNRKHDFINKSMKLKSLHMNFLPSNSRFIIEIISYRDTVKGSVLLKTAEIRFFYLFLPFTQRIDSSSSSKVEYIIPDMIADVLIRVFESSDRKPIFHLIFNTSFLTNALKLTFYKYDLDFLSKYVRDKR